MVLYLSERLTPLTAQRTAVPTQPLLKRLGAQADRAAYADGYEAHECGYSHAGNGKGASQGREEPANYARNQRGQEDTDNCRDHPACDAVTEAPLFAGEQITQPKARRELRSEAGKYFLLPSFDLISDGGFRPAHNAKLATDIERSGSPHANSPASVAMEAL